MEEVMGAETIKKLMEDGGFVTIPADEKVQLVKIEGEPFSPHAIEPSTIEALKTWQARDDDVFVVSYPKAGTTWIQEVVSAICSNGNLEKLSKSHTVFRVPFMEKSRFKSTKEIQVPPTYKLLDKMKSPRTIKSHLPGHLLPPDIMQKKAKIVYIARNPKDVAVSLFYFHYNNPLIPSYEAWDDFFNDYYIGNVIFGPWWKHYLYYWNKRDEPNVLFLKFEDMKCDLKDIVCRTADFLGYSLPEDKMNDIVNHCTFENMKKNPMTNPDTLFKHLYKQIENEKYLSLTGSSREDEVRRTSFMRKGKVGDWKNHFTVAQNDAMDELILEKLKGSGLKFN